MATTTSIRELAKALGLAPSTVSKAMNDSSEISQQTKEKVREMAKVLCYVPNFHAQNLKIKTTKKIGVIVPNVMDDFFAKVIHGIEKETSKHGYTLSITFSNDKKNCEQKNLLNLVKQSVDGVLISFAKETQKTQDYSAIKKICSYGIPVVMFDRVYTGIPCDTVTIDDYKGSYNATEYLYQSGCKRIIFLSSISNTSVGHLRKKGYLAAIKNCKRENINPFFMEFASYKKFNDTFLYTLSKKQFDGIVAADEISAIHALNTAQHLGYKVPHDLSIFGFTDGPMARSSNPTLSVVTQQAEMMGSKSFHLLRRRLIDPGAKISQIVLRPELLVRGSTKQRLQKKPIELR